MLTTDTTAMLAPTLMDTDVPTDMDMDTPDTDTTARGPLMPSLLLRLRLMLTTDTTAMPAPTPMDTDTDTVPTDTPDTDTTARGPLRLRPRPRLRPMPLSFMVPTDTPMASVPTAMAPSDML